eukprot:COSAG01_NODE_57496_length_312_cov_0.469484_1_plen_60_part_10
MAAAAAASPGCGAITRQAATLFNAHGRDDIGRDRNTKCGLTYRGRHRVPHLEVRGAPVLV